MIENFTNCRHLVIPPGTTDYFVKLRVYDTQNRLLQLGVRIQADKGGSLKVEPYPIPGSFLKHEYLKTELNVDNGTYAIV